MINYSNESVFNVEICKRTHFQVMFDIELLERQDSLLSHHLIVPNPKGQFEFDLKIFLILHFLPQLAAKRIRNKNKA